MSPNSFIETLPKAKNLTSHYEFIDRLAKENPFELMGVFEDLLAHKSEFDRIGQFRSAYDRIIEAVCLSAGADQITVAFSLYARQDSDKVKKRIASFLTSKQEIETLINKILERRNAIDSYLVELVAHELVCRGYDLRSYAEFNKFASLISIRTKFKSLPLFPLSIEKELALRRDSIGSAGWSIPFGLHKQPFEKLESRPRVIHDFKEVADISLPVQAWVNESNGSAVGLKGTATAQIDAKLLLEQIDFEPLHASNFKLSPITPNDAFRKLFSASANGGAYGAGERAATARLNAWIAINAMVSDEAFIDAHETERKAIDYTWYEFTLDNLFMNEWLDLGIIGIGASQKDFAILAATDID